LDERTKLAKTFDIYETEETKSQPLLYEIVKAGLNNQVSRSKKIDVILFFSNFSFLFLNYFFIFSPFK
jgi:hypothetical protein